MNGRLEIPNIKIEHSGEYTCQAIGYPRSQAGSSVPVTLNVEKCEFLIYFKPLNSSKILLGTAAWNLKYRVKNRKIRLGLVPHIDKEFFGTGNSNSKVIFTSNIKL